MSQSQPPYQKLTFSKSEHTNDANREQEKKKPYPLGAKHRFEVGEEGHATDYKSEREIAGVQQYLQEEQERLKKEFFEEAGKQQEYEAGNSLFWIGLGCVIFPSIYMWSEGLGAIPIIIIIIGVLLIGLNWRAGIFERDSS